MLVGPGGIWMTGLAGDATATVVDHLDVDPSNVPLVQYCHDQFYGICQAWAVPDAFLQQFQQGAEFLSAMTPDMNNGHFTAMSDVRADGAYRMWTWGAWCWVSQAFVMSVDAQCFATFSALQFNAQGFDSHGRHVSDVAAAWVSIGGSSAAVAPVVSKFPPEVTPAPPGTVVTLAQAQGWAAAGINAGDPLQTREQAIAAANAGLQAGWP